MANNPIDDAVKVLTDLQTIDPDACDKLLNLCVDANEALAKHPTIQVRVVRNVNQISPLGLINGILEAVTGKRIAMLVDNGKCVGFAPYQTPQQTTQPPKKT